jgi:hypothetical protein
MPQRKLYDIPSLPESYLKSKYVSTTNIYNDPNTVENFMKETLRDRGSDKPIFEHELPRQSRNMLSSSLLHMQEYGSRYKRDPYHPELFLGDLSKDQRQSDTAPLVAQMAEQHRFRHEKYIRGKLQDVGDVRAEGTIGTKRMLKQIKQGYSNMATRMGGIFDDSTNGMIARTNPHPGNSTHKVGDAIKEDQAIYEVNDEKILPKYSTDIVNKLSNMVGIQWSVQPDNKYGLSSVSNVYRSKGEVDLAANAVFRSGEQDTKFKTEQFEIKNKTVVPRRDIIKAARLNAQEVRVALKSDSSKNNKFTNMMIPPPLVSRVDGFVGTQSKKEQLQGASTVFKYKPGTKRTETLVEPIKVNNGVDTTYTPAIPTKDRLAVVYQINQTHKSASREDTERVRSHGLKALARAFVERNDTLQEHVSKDTFQSMQYNSGVPNKAIDHVSNTKLTKSKTAPPENMQSNPTGTNTLPSIKNVDDFKFDTDPTMNNEYQTRSGVSQRMTRLSKMQDQDSVVNPVNDTIVPYRTKYSS